MATTNNDWQTISLGDCVDILDSQRVPVNSGDRSNRHGDVPYYGATGQVGWIDDFLFDEELLLLGEDGAPFLDKSKPIAYIINGKSWVNNHAHVLRAKQSLTSNWYLKHYLDYVDYSDYVSGTTRLKLNQGMMKKIPVLLPDKETQLKLEALFKKTFDEQESTRGKIQRSKLLIQKFRQAVLSAAVTGKLTEEWREKNPQKTTDLEHKSKTDSDYDLPEIPETWSWYTVSDIGQVKGGKRVPKGRKLLKSITDHPYLKAGNLKKATIDANDLEYLDDETFEQIKRYIISKNDVYITIAGTIGQVGIIPEELDGANLTENAAKITNLQSCDKTYLLFCLQSTFVRSIIGYKTVSSAVGKLALFRIESLPVPLPSLDEQLEINKKVKALFDGADKVEAQIEKAELRVEKLTQSILARAFNGEL